MSSDKSFFGHPRGLATLFFTEMWERFSYYGMRAILVLFMTSPVAREGMGLDVEESAAIYGLYTASVYLMSLPGGWLADNVFGQRKSVWYGGIFIMFGHLILAVPGDKHIFFLGLALVSIGTGLLKPNVSTMVGDLYPAGGARRDSGFSIFYMGINLGSFLGQILVSLVGEKVNWHLGFGLAAFGMFLGLVQYRLTSSTLGAIGMTPKGKTDAGGAGRTANHKWLLIFAALSVLVIILLDGIDAIDLQTARGLAEAVGMIIVTVTMFYFLYILTAGGLDAAERKRVFVIFFLFAGSALFWAGFEQAGSSLNLFARDYTDRLIGGWLVPAGALQAANAAFIIMLAPLFGALWIKLAAKNMNPGIPIKFAFGLIMMALGFLIMYFAALVATRGELAGMGWLVFTYFLHSAGELTLSPVGLSATTKLAPARYAGQMMGIWFVGTALGNLVAGLFAGGFDRENAREIPALFMSVVVLGMAAGVFFIIFNPVLKRWMGNIR